MTERVYLGGVTNTTLHLENDGTIHVEERQDCEAILEDNQRKRDHRFGSARGAVAEEAFQIPMTLVLQWQRDCGAAMFSDEHMAYMNRKLSEPEFAKLSTSTTRRDPRIVMTGMR